MALVEVRQPGEAEEAKKSVRTAEHRAWLKEDNGYYVYHTI
jgi:hypothetical protein